MRNAESRVAGDERSEDPERAESGVAGDERSEDPDRSKSNDLFRPNCQSKYAQASA